MKLLKTKFSNRDEATVYLKELCPWADGNVSKIKGGHKEAQLKLSQIDPINYGKTRNFAKGKVTRLSPYIHHGILNLAEVKDHALSKVSQPEQVTKFIQELAWREFWQVVAKQHPEWLWNDAESYKTGFTANDYADELPNDIREAKTGLSCIDYFINELINTGYVHNHARMYLASYIVHFRRIKWQAGAEWFLELLLDGDEASNNFSWQWVASTFSNKPYIFNLENVEKYFGGIVDCTAKNNRDLNFSYEELTAKLFPHLGINHD